MSDVAVTGDAMTLEKLVEVYEYNIQCKEGDHVLRSKADEILAQGTWRECIGKMIELMGNVEVHHVVLVNIVYFWRADERIF